MLSDVFPRTLSIKMRNSFDTRVGTYLFRLIRSSTVRSFRGAEFGWAAILNFLCITTNARTEENISKFFD